MNRSPAPPTHRRPLAMRVWGNPLARSFDRAEAVLVIGLVVVWLLSIPFVATIASAEWPATEARVVAVQQSVTAADAVLVSDADLAIDDAHATTVTRPMASATWTGRDGRATGGMIVVRVGARAGDHQTIWLDEHGAVVDPPMATRTAAGLLVLAAAGGWLLLGGLLLGCWWAVRLVNDRGRQRRWAAEWASFDAGSRSS